MLTPTPRPELCVRGESHKAENTEKRTKISFRAPTAREAAWLSSTAGGAAGWGEEQLGCDSWREPQDVSGNQHLDKKRH